MDEHPFRGLGPNPPARPSPDDSEFPTAAGVETLRKAIDVAAAELRARAFLYDDPHAYTAGVRDVLSQVDVPCASRAPSVEK